MASVQPIEITTADQVTLRGQRWDGGDQWVVLFHDAGRDLDAWQPLLAPLTARGYSLLTLDLRGHGLSDGDWDADKVALDLRAAVTYARENGAAAISFAGAGESALPALTEPESRQFRAIILLSPGPLGDRSAELLRGPGIPKLFVVGTLDTNAAESTDRLHKRGIGWAVVVRLPTAGQGTALLASEWGRLLVEDSIAFLEEQRYSSGVKPRLDSNSAAAEALRKRLFGA